MLLLDASYHMILNIPDRRSINRKSAQKHRIRRKAEIDTLNRHVAERDARIAQLLQELAAEKARSCQLVDFLKDRTKDSGSGILTQPW